MVWNKGKINKVIQKCVTCGIEHEEWPSVNPKYCSRACYYKSNRGKPSGSTGIKWTKEQKLKLKLRIPKSGEEHWNWKGGMDKYYSSYFRRTLRKMIKDRDENKCTECGSRDGLVVHHIDYDKRNDNINNLITMCKVCHGRLHAKK